MAIELSENTKSDIHSLTSLCSSIFKFLELAVGSTGTHFPSECLLFKTRRHKSWFSYHFLKI